MRGRSDTLRLNTRSSSQTILSEYGCDSSGEALDWCDAFESCCWLVVMISHRLDPPWNMPTIIATELTSWLENANNRNRFNAFPRITTTACLLEEYSLSTMNFYHQLAVYWPWLICLRTAPTCSGHDHTAHTAQRDDRLRTATHCSHFGNVSINRLIFDCRKTKQKL